MTKHEKELVLKNAKFKTRVAKLEADNIMLLSELRRAEYERERVEDQGRLDAVRRAFRIRNER